MRIMLNNDFHFKHAWFEVAGLPATLTVNQARRARRLLCGRKGCTCGIVRGMQYTAGERLSVSPTTTPGGQPTWYIEESEET